MNMIGKMEHNQISEETPILYFNNFDLLGPIDVVTLCNYRSFIEKIIIRLGEDWRFESNLLAEEIVNLRKVDDMQEDLTQFNIFN